MFCHDPYLTYLKTFGYCVVLVPKEDVAPLQVMAKQKGVLMRLGDLKTLLVSGSNIPLPEIIKDKHAADISGQRTGEMKIGIGLSIMGTLIGAMGGSEAGLKAQYQQAKTSAFEFTEVLEDRVEILAIDQYLTDADVNPFSSYVAQLLEADELYITTATIKSKKFTVEAKKANGQALEVKLPEIQGMVGGDVSVSGQAEVTTKVTYEGKKHLVFGFQAVRLFYEEGRYTAFKLVEPGVALRGDEASEERTHELLETESPFLHVDFNV